MITAPVVSYNHDIIIANNFVFSFWMQTNQSIKCNHSIFIHLHQWRSQKFVMEGALPLPPLSPPPLPFFLPLPPLPLQVGPLKSGWKFWGSAVSSPNGVWGAASAEIEFGAFQLQNMTSGGINFNYFPFSTEGVWTPQTPSLAMPLIYTSVNNTCTVQTLL